MLLRHLPLNCHCSWRNSTGARTVICESYHNMLYLWSYPPNRAVSDVLEHLKLPMGGRPQSPAVPSTGEWDNLGRAAVAEPISVCEVP